MSTIGNIEARRDLGAHMRPVINMPATRGDTYSDLDIPESPSLREIQAAVHDLALGHGIWIRSDITLERNLMLTMRRLVDAHTAFLTSPFRPVDTSLTKREFAEEIGEAIILLIDVLAQNRIDTEQLVRELHHRHVVDLTPTQRAGLTSKVSMLHPNGGQDRDLPTTTTEPSMENVHGKPEPRAGNSPPATGSETQGA